MDVVLIENPEGDCPGEDRPCRTCGATAGERCRYAPGPSTVRAALLALADDLEADAANERNEYDEGERDGFRMAAERARRLAAQEG